MSTDAMTPREKRIIGNHWRQRIDDMVSEATLTAWPRLMREPSLRLYLYYRKSTETKYGELVVATECPGDYHLASNAPLSPALTREHLQRWISEQARTLPLIPCEV